VKNAGALGEEEKEVHRSLKPYSAREEERESLREGSERKGGKDIVPPCRRTDPETVTGEPENLGFFTIQRSGTD